jgi:hypothetical protein
VLMFTVHHSSPSWRHGHDPFEGRGAPGLFETYTGNVARLFGWLLAAAGLGLGLV